MDHNSAITTQLLNQTINLVCLLLLVQQIRELSLKQTFEITSSALLEGFQVVENKVAEVAVIKDAMADVFDFSISDSGDGTPGEVSEAMMNSAINNANSISALDTSFSHPPTLAELQTLGQKMNEIILNGRQRLQESGTGICSDESTGCVDFKSPPCHHISLRGSEIAFAFFQSGTSPTLKAQVSNLCHFPTSAPCIRTVLKALRQEMNELILKAMIHHPSLDLSRLSCFHRWINS
jgi:hypothetical protein